MIQIPQKPKNDKVKISVDLSEENYDKLVELKNQSHTSIGKIINIVLEESLKNTAIEA